MDVWGCLVPWLKDFHPKGEVDLQSQSGQSVLDSI